MAEASDIQGQITQCLRDAGCTDEMIADFMASHRKSEEAGHRLLTSHRKMLLDDLHVCQKRIDCLDYLLYKLNF